MNKSEWKLALAADPSSDIDLQSVDCDSLPTDFIKTNKLSLLLRQGGLNVPGTDHDAEKNEILLEALSKVVTEFEDKSVEFVLIKWPPLEMPHGDLDIVVSDGLGAAENVLRDLGYEYEDDPDVYRRKYVKSDDKFTWEVDLHIEAAWVGIEYLNSDDIVVEATHRNVGGTSVPMPSPTFDSLIWAAHDMRSNKIPLSNILHSHNVLHDADLQRARRIAQEYGWGKQLSTYCRAVENVHEKVFNPDREDVPSVVTPIQFETTTMLGLKARKLLNDTISRGPSAGIRDMKSYLTFDVPELISGM